MTLTPIQQAAQALAVAKSVLVIAGGEPHGDRIASLLAMVDLLQSKDRSVTAVCTKPVPENLRFLAGSEKVQTTIPVGGNLTIALDVAKSPLHQLSYKVENEQLKILISPKTGFELDPKKITTQLASTKFDYIVTINTHDLSTLVSHFKEQSELFYNTPIINIDHSSANEQYGKINVVDISAASTTIIVHTLRAQMLGNSRPLTPALATLFLAGINAATNSYQSYQTSPHVLKLSADLITAGANQQEIVRNLYKTKELSTLNLWGRVLARLKEAHNGKLIWSLVSREDFAKAQASHESIDSVLKELLTTIPGAEVLMVLYENDHHIGGKIHAPKTIDALQVASLFTNASGHADAADFHIAVNSLQEAEKEITEKVVTHLKEAGH